MFFYNITGGSDIPDSAGFDTIRTAFSFGLSGFVLIHIALAVFFHY